MIKSFNGQLLDFMNKNRQDSNISLLKREEFFSKSKKRLKHGILLLQALLCLLPEGDIVFIILDSLSRLSGDEKEGHKLMKALNGIMDSQENISIRVLVTDPSVDSPLRRIAQWQLHLPDNVSGGDAMDVDDTTKRICKGLVDSHRTGDLDGEVDSEDSEETRDEEEDSDNSSDEDEDDDEEDGDDSDG